MFRGFRTRLIATVIALVGLTAALVAIPSYLIVRDSLRDQLVEDSVARAEFNITTLASTDQLAESAGRSEFEESGLLDRFLLRGSGGVYVEFANGQTFASSLTLFGVADLLSSELRQVVARGNFGYEFLTIDETPTLIVGGRRPPTGPDFYFLYSAADSEKAVSQIARILALTGVAVLLVGALGAGFVAKGLLRPVAVAARAAASMTEGDLSVRLPAESDDELGELAVAFNQMATSLEHQIHALVGGRERERRFVADVSHELRTPITALVNEAAMLQRRLDELPDTERRVGQMLVADVNRLRDLVEDLLELSRLSSASPGSAVDEVDVDLFLAAVIAERHPSAVLRTEDVIGSVRVERGSLERVIGNLLDNAKHHAQDAQVVVDATRTDEGLRIQVIDDGPGVPDDQLAHLFDRFFKLDPARQGGSGSGLGLAIALEHARHLGGDLSVRSGPSQGLTFELVVPVTESLHSGDTDETVESQPGT